jgi:hypothetical protein
VSARRDIEGDSEHPTRDRTQSIRRPSSAEDSASLAGVGAVDGTLGPQSATALLRLQRMVGNQAVVGLITGHGAPVVQRKDVVDRAAAQLTAKPSDESIDAVRTYKLNSKKTPETTWVRILGEVKTAEPFWEKIKGHVMLGEDEKPPKGFHSTKKADDAHVEPVGERSPKTAGASVIYKRWTRQKGDDTYDHLKISSFFPDNWPEAKIQAAVLLKDSAAEHQVQSAFSLTSNEGTTFPTTTCDDPEKPKKAKKK